MAIVKTKTLTEVRYVPLVDIDGATTQPMGNLVSCSYTYTIDDTEDDDLPVVTNKNFIINQGDDVSSHDPLVQNICNAVWAD
jgi:hypothetical protein